MNFSRLSEAQLDALKEISNIGMGHAATALSRLIGGRVGMRVPRVTFTGIAQVPALLGGEENVVAGITLQVCGDARGNILLVFPRASARQLLARLLGEEGQGPALSELGISTLKEVGNILASAYLSALGQLLHMNLLPSVPLFACDGAGTVVEEVLLEFSRSGDLALMVETEFHGEEGPGATICGHFFLLPDPLTLNIILAAVGSER